MEKETFIGQICLNYIKKSLDLWDLPLGGPIYLTNMSVFVAFEKVWSVIE
jgi:hypothetical protein